ncbi:MAG: endonuclease III [Candidatus Raymondbacteria bacterium RifOxyA12_full_50_37]|uniref:Endonuclease III n=1 Tax=Candidatus Raymondbacteria bacterium RIFOXYD12_FULL_49_13 TaxID=1817890 RepID=A0A1F7FK35_UNCRA|nr:MAG: endonuclease III [Candidatus Raymondbacteria bacterium RifOxyA12_full_50_37]OGJ90838.1 MAG: endonuclease III [Candidatus Raymondbacteria bacterium RIFOXYA2_FULL_49_16]OGJ98645.1 MAG: endonuclease III [Candidatus Raymondbacteria bacterium RIFOXYC2_FULL_50_21]OGK00415.1 MAG: endonuclease III [Candidatus Raymondbacteria bacterium RifOxyB12_full_50_8]OGK05249.1 MAG: endonuclease III [Candidatus Raymondbacteria bacterium RifOxyC12_full_50_8]OGK07085.1 MAG: endonuclease III [Candidatus Raymo
MAILRKGYSSWYVPIVTKIADTQRDPFQVLIATIISLRTKDDVTAAASERLFGLARTPERMARLSEHAIRTAIFPAGFYKTKARTIISVCAKLESQYNGRVPDTLEELLAFKGVGRKTANLVLGEGFGIPAICVDTHVHRISNRFGVVHTKTPEETEFALREILPKKHWIRYNTFLVAFGQNVCKPISPLCSACRVRKYCKRVNVTRAR